MRDTAFGHVAMGMFAVFVGLAAAGGAIASLAYALRGEGVAAGLVAVASTLLFLRILPPRPGR